MCTEINYAHPGLPVSKGMPKLPDVEAHEHGDHADVISKRSNPGIGISLYVLMALVPNCFGRCMRTPPWRRQLQRNWSDL